MTKTFRMNYLKAIYPRYRKASKALKSRILDEFCRVCGYHRKYAIGKLRLSAKPSVARTARRHPKTYDPAVLRIVAVIWEAANYPWSARLKEILRLWLPWVKQHFPLTPEIEKKLLRISPSTIDRCLKDRKQKLKRRIYGRTKPGTLLKHHIPIKTDHWDVKRPGFVEVDLVSHSGNSASGEFLYSLNLTDIYSSWVETRAVMGKGETGVLIALQQIRQSLPFELLGLDSDNGSEFLNHHLWRYCQNQKIQFTRSRPYKKDDNAHIEQKNWTHVRKLLGWDRYDSLQALHAINDLYQSDLRLFMNLYQPSVRLLKTTRIGSKLKRLYDKPKTPLDRLIASKQADPTKLAQLKALRESVDPFELSRTVNHKLEQIWRLAHHRFQPPKPSQSSAHSTAGLSKVEEQTLNQISKTFSIHVYVRNKKGELITLNHGKILT
jgi:hypothetical protein